MSSVRGLVPSLHYARVASGRYAIIVPMRNARRLSFRADALSMRASVAGASAALHRAHVPTSAILLVAGSVFCFTMLDAITRFTTQLYPVPVLVWARYLVQTLAMLIWLGPSMRLGMIRTARLPLQVVRALVVLASSLLFVTALRYLPLAEATALNYCTPVIVVVMGRLFLHEPMTPARIAFVVAGAIGMLLIVRPGTAVFHGAAAYALLAALCYAGYQILTRLLAGENPRVLLFYPAIIGTLVMSALAPGFDWPAAMPWTHVALVIAGGLFGTLGHFLFILAFRHAPASAITPFTYMQLVWATLVGWVLYRHFPDATAIIGMLVIAGSGLAIALFERRQARAPAPTSVSEV
jgi:drug/metabolite transporter (DMT)-like permease